MARRTNEPRPHTRKLSERNETITVILTDDEVATQRQLACEIRDRIDAHEEKLKSIQAEHKGKQKEMEEQERAARRLASTRKRDVEMTVADYLEDGLDGIQVVRRRIDTMERLGDPRPATSAERQETLPLSGSPDEGGFGS